MTRGELNRFKIGDRVVVIVSNLPNYYVAGNRATLIRQDKDGDWFGKLETPIHPDCPVACLTELGARRKLHIYGGLMIAIYPRLFQ